MFCSLRLGFGGYRPKIWICKAVLLWPVCSFMFLTMNWTNYDKLTRDAALLARFCHWQCCSYFFSSWCANHREWTEIWLFASLQQNFAIRPRLVVPFSQHKKGQLAQIHRNSCLFWEVAEVDSDSDMHRDVDRERERERERKKKTIATLSM